MAEALLEEQQRRCCYSLVAIFPFSLLLVELRLRLRLRRWGVLTLRADYDPHDGIAVAAADNDGRVSVHSGDQ